MDSCAFLTKLLVLDAGFYAQSEQVHLSFAIFRDFGGWAGYCCRFFVLGLDRYVWILVHFL